MTSQYELRDAVAADASQLVLLADAATRCFFSWIWAQPAADGQSALEPARTSVMTDTTSVNHFGQWAVAEHEGAVIAGLNSYVQPAVVASTDVSPTVAAVVAPLDELKTLAEGSWYISVASVFPEGRGKGIGTALLELAEDKARAAGVSQLTLLAGSFNTGALRLYERTGYGEWERRPFVPFPGSDTGGDWVLMVKDVP